MALPPTTADQIEQYLAEYRRQAAWASRRWPSLDPSVHASWRMTEKAMGWEPPGTLKGWIEDENGRVTTLEL